jgi:AraC-like DNA-binding protein
VDVLDQILSSLRLNGGVITDATFTGDYCVQAEFTPEKCAPFFPMPEHLIGYHYVRSGKTTVEVDGLPPMEVSDGEVVILPRNARHVLASEPGLEPARVEDVTVVTADGLHRIELGSPGPETQVWCGFLGTAHSSAHPLLESLPPMLKIDLSDGQAQWLDSSMRFVAHERPSSEMVARLAELFIGQAIREYVEELPDGAEGWLAGLRDPSVAKALDIIHNRYAEELDVETLAREVGVSRSVLGERFAELIGEPPMRYCARWRMRIASVLLREGRDSTANIAYSVGFNSEEAFNRAFKREFGEPPATWRRKVEALDAERMEELKRASAAQPAS